MIEIIGPALNQWDTGRLVKITGIEAATVHFANVGDSKAPIMALEDSQAKIPDYLLQTGKQLCVYAVKNGITVESKIFYVKKRERPENYVYEDDQRNYIYQLITDAQTAIEEAGKATAGANLAATNANTSAAGANAATENANSAAAGANLAAENANKAADKVSHTAKNLMVIGSAKGNSIHLDDAIDQFLVGLRIFGKTTQNGTPTPDAPVDLVSAGGEGNLSVSIAGKNLFGGDALADRLVKIGNATKDTTEGTVQFAGNQVSRKMLYSGFKKNTTYTIILKGWNTFGDGSNLWINYTDGSNAYLTFPASQTLSTIVYKTPADKTVKAIGGIEYAGSTYLYYDQCGVFEGNITIDDFETYIGRSVSVDTPNGLPGIPVSSGGNYTDENGQQWICDEIDLTRGMYVQRDVRSSNLVWKVADNNGYPVGNSLLFRTSIADVLGNTPIRHRAALCNKLPYTNNALNNEINGFYFSYGTIYARIAGVSDLDTFLGLMNGAEIITFMDNYIETPLSEEELAAYAALKTYRGNTTVSDDAGAWMDIEYVMDAKKYIDSQISAGILEATVE